jgi:hypothetical protein
MQVVKKITDQRALAIEQSAAALGLDEFSLLLRIQAGEITAVRARTGEIVIPESALERIAGGPVGTQSLGEGLILPDHRLGIEQKGGRLKCEAERRPYYRISGSDEHFSEGEINSYRAAFSAIARQVESMADLNRQLSGSRQIPESCDLEVNTPQTGHWEVCSALLNLNLGEILLCQRGGEFAVIERFHEDSLFAQFNGSARILLQGSDPYQLTKEFKAGAKLTLEFMASNLAAKAQKIVWERFPKHRPGEVMATISEQCHCAIASETAISQTQDARQNVRRGISI